MTTDPVNAGIDHSPAVGRTAESQIEWFASLLALLVLVLLALVFYHLTPGAFSGGAVDVMIRPG